MEYEGAANRAQRRNYANPKAEPLKAFDLMPHADAPDTNTPAGVLDALGWTGKVVVRGK